MDGNSYNVASNEKGNTGVALGAIGTGLGILNGGASMLGWGRNGGYANNNNDPNSRFITKGELDLVTENTNLKSELAIQKSENYTDKKLVEVTTYVDSKINRLADKVEGYYHEQQGVNAQQMAYNAAANANIDVLKSQTAQLMGVTKLFIPSSNVCQQGCGCGCGCGANS